MPLLSHAEIDHCNGMEGGRKRSLIKKTEKLLRQKKKASKEYFSMFILKIRRKILFLIEKWKSGTASGELVETNKNSRKFKRSLWL